MHTSRTFLFFLLVVALAFEAKVDVQREIENRLFRNYDRRHRPVKDQSTTTNIHMFLVVNHIESVDEVEQTMLVHGTLWAVWMDEYLTWDPKAYNDTNTLSIQPWKIWQPALSLYNAARSNSWYLYFNGKPHVVTSNGFVSAMGTFSFSITCNFDYSDFPNDKQECPIVLTDWIYDLSKVNLTTGIGNYVRSMIKLSGNPFEETEKRHLGGWEFTNMTERVCYYGLHGCEKNYPDGSGWRPLDSYWSLAEFRIHLQRHSPYFSATIRLPIILSVSLALLAFWIENLHSAVVMVLASILLECFTGYSLMKMLPPSSGRAPKIVYFYALTFVIELIVLTAHIVFIFAREVMPEDMEFPYQITAWTEKMRQWSRVFRSDGIVWKSFDPQDFETGDVNKPAEGDLLDTPYQTQQPSTSLFDHDDSNDLFSSFANPNTDVQMEEIPHGTEITLPDETPAESRVEVEPAEQKLNGKKAEEKPVDSKQSGSKSPSLKRSHLEEEIHTWRRTLFLFLFFCSVLVILIFGLI